MSGEAIMGEDWERSYAAALADLRKLSLDYEWAKRMADALFGERRDFVIRNSMSGVDLVEAEKWAVRVLDGDGYVPSDDWED